MLEVDGWQVMAASWPKPASRAGPSTFPEVPFPAYVETFYDLFKIGLASYYDGTGYNFLYLD